MDSTQLAGLAIIVFGFIGLPLVGIFVWQRWRR